jgi:hypothetical protein
MSNQQISLRSSRRRNRSNSGTTGLACTEKSPHYQAMSAILPKRRTAAATTNETAGIATMSIEATPAAV